MEKEVDKFLSETKRSLESLTFVKIVLTSYKGVEKDLQKISIRKVLVKKKEQLCFTYKYKTKDIVKNYAFAETLERLETLIGFENFQISNLLTTQFDLSIQFHKKEKIKVVKHSPSIRELPSMSHDKKKQRKIEGVGKQYLHELKITNEAGQVYKTSQDKFKQINQYIEILSSLLLKLPAREVTKVVDMGAGKGYLTFALYDYLNNVINKPASVVGVEYREELVALCNEIAVKSSFNQLQFVKGEIEKYKNNDIDVLIALHACDTATDDAIAKGIESDADLIVVAPCCHKQIRREIENNKAQNDLDFLLKHGIFLERQAEMTTDGIRSLILEYYGYSTKVVEFISDAHTPKNVLIIGIKTNNTIDQAAILNKIKNIKSFFGITYHHLEKKMEMNG